MLHTIDRRKSKQIGHILCVNCLLKHFIEENIRGSIKVIEEKEDTNSYWITLEKKKDTGKSSRPVFLNLCETAAR